MPETSNPPTQVSEPYDPSSLARRAPDDPPRRSELHTLHREFSRIQGPGGHVAIIEERKE